MKKSVPVILLTAVMLCLLLAEAARAQDTLTYATVDYDEETNAIYGYAYTEPDYAAGIYYQTAHVGAKLRDGDNTELAIGSQQNYGRAELYLQASGNGNPPYWIQSGHYVFLTYYVNNYYDSYAYQYRNGYLDYNYYTFFTSGGAGFPVFDIPNFFNFIGRSPQAITPSINIFLGTLLSQFFAPSVDTINYKTAKVDSTSRNFNSLTNNAELPLNETSGGANYCFGSASNPFTLILDFDLPSDTSDVLQDSRSFMSDNTATDQFSRMSALQFSNIDLSGVPKKGRVSVSMFRKRPLANFPNNKVRITVAGRISGGGSFSTTARVKLTCP